MVINLKSFLNSRYLCVCAWNLWNFLMNFGILRILWNAYNSMIEFPNVFVCSEKSPNRGRVVWRISIPGSDISLWPHHSLEGNPLPTGPTITPGRRKTHYIQYVKVVDIQQHLLENQYNSNNIKFPFHDSAYKIESVCSEIQRRGQMSLWMQYLVFFCQRKSTFSFNQHSEKLLWQPFWIFRIPTK